MEISTIIGIIGTIATLGFGGYSVWVYYKQNNSTQITFFRNECFSLFQSIVNSLDGVEINYNGEQINNSLILLSGSIINSGGKDIDKQVVYEPLKLEEISDYKFLQVKINQVSEGVIAEVNISTNNQIEFSWDLLKSGEFLSFTVIIQYVGGEKKTNEILNKFINGIRYSHRITNLKRVLNGTLGKYYNRPTKRLFIIASIFYLLTGIGILSKPYIYPKLDLKYHINENNTYLGAGNIKIKDIDNLGLSIEGTLDSEISLNQFNQTIKISKVEIKKDQTNDMKDFILGIITLTGGLLIIWVTYNWYFKGSSYLKLLANVNAVKNTVENNNGS